MDIIGDIVAIGKTVLKTFYNTLYPNVSSGTTAPTLTPAKVGDIYVDKADASRPKFYIANGTSSSANWRKINGSYELQTLMGSAITLASGTTYYFGNNAGFTTVKNICQLCAARIGSISVIDVYGSGTAGSNEAASLYIRVNDTTDYLISDNISITTNRPRFSVSNLNIPLSVGDLFEYKLVCPTYATPPNTFAFRTQIAIDL